MGLLFDTIGSDGPGDNGEVGRASRPGRASAGSEAMTGQSPALLNV